MNKLREKLAQLFDGLRTESLNDLEQITDDFSVRFAEWLENNCTSIINDGVYKSKRLLLSELEYYTTTELLQIFKTQYYGK